MRVINGESLKAFVVVIVAFLFCERAFVAGMCVVILEHNIPLAAFLRWGDQFDISEHLVHKFFIKSSVTMIILVNGILIVMMMYWSQSHCRPTTKHSLSLCLLVCQRMPQFIWWHQMNFNLINLLRSKTCFGKPETKLMSLFERSLRESRQGTREVSFLVSIGRRIFFFPM